MVKEQRYIFDIQDIKSLIYACSHCGQEVVCELKGDYHPGSHCVSCRQSLQGNSNSFDPHFTLLTNLRSVLKMSDPPVRVRFVVPDSKVNQATNAL